MANQKIICIILTLIFGLSLFASGALGRVTCDKEQCKHHTMKSLQYQKAKINFVPMGCCARTQKDPCDLEGGQAVVLHDWAHSMVRANYGDPSAVFVIHSDHASEDHSLTTLRPHPQTAAIARSAPIYIQNLSLLF